MAVRMICACGYEFDPTNVGIYGCPNCEGEGMTKTYRIERLFFRGGRRTTKRGLTLEQAQAHCTNPETSSSTCQRPQNVARTRKLGAWFDSYTEE